MEIQVINQLSELFESFIKDYNLPSNFFKNLFEENDWSFIVKTSALIEVVSTTIILYHLKEPGLKSVVSRLELNNDSTGKIALLKKMGLLGSSEISFINELSTLRNELVHDINNLNFNFNSWVNSLDKNQIKSKSINLNPHHNTIDRIYKKNQKKLSEELKVMVVKQPNLSKLKQDFKSNPKKHIILGLHQFLINISDMKGYSDFINIKKYSSFIDGHVDE